MNRRNWLIGGAAASFIPVAARGAAPRSPVQAEPGEAPVPFDPRSPLPHKSGFFPLHGTYLNAGAQHPLSRGAMAAMKDYLRYRTMAGDVEYSSGAVRGRIREAFARLINAAPDEISLVQSTTAGENLVIDALGIPASGGRIVTDSLHFFGSFPTYGELARRGMDVVTLRHRDGRIDIDEVEAAVTRNTRLVALSSVSTFNGFEHDLKRVCEIAHAKGALVFADIIHSAGAVPLDVRASGVDFCSTASYKWLMGDMGLGFLFARRDRLDDIRRPWVGYHQVTAFESHVFPGDPPGESVADYELGDTATGYFAMGTNATVVAAALDYSLPYLLETGVERIQRYRQPLIERLQAEVPRLGFAPLTPPESTTALVAFECPDARTVLGPVLDAAGIYVSLSRNHFRVSPSVFNDMDDVDHLINVLETVKERS